MRLADGDTSTRIPATHARDEIGEMARTVIVFCDNMIEREKLATIQAEASRAQEQRSSTISLTIGQFKHSVENVLGPATEEIAEQIGAIQSAAADSAQAIEQVNTIIREMSTIDRGHRRVLLVDGGRHHGGAPRASAAPRAKRAAAPRR